MFHRFRQLACASAFRRAAAFALLALAPALLGPAWGQGAPPGRPRFLQAGVGVVPGGGVQLALVSPRSIITVEGAFYADVTPTFGGGEGSVQFSAGVGGALRPLQLARLLTNTAPTRYDVDFGLRLGPGLFFAFNETRAAKNQRFSLFLEPFLRFTTELASGRTVFAEAGIQRPLLRAGFWFAL